MTDSIFRQYYGKNYDKAMRHAKEGNEEGLSKEILTSLTLRLVSTRV